MYDVSSGWLFSCFNLLTQTYNAIYTPNMIYIKRFYDLYHTFHLPLPGFTSVLRIDICDSAT